MELTRYPFWRHILVPATKSASTATITIPDSHCDYLPADLGGKSLVAGVYKSKARLMIQNGSLTLDAAGDSNAVWVFEAPIGITTIGGNGGNIILKGGAQSQNIFWKTDKTMSIGAGTEFMGNIVPLTFSSMTNSGKSIFDKNGFVSILKKTFIK